MVESSISFGEIYVSDSQFHEHSGTAFTGTTEGDFAIPEDSDVDQNDVTEILTPDLSERIELAMDRMIGKPSRRLGMPPSFLRYPKSDNLRVPTETGEMSRTTRNPIEIGVTTLQDSRFQFL